MYEMKPEYYTGIEAIDKEHERLFELAQETHELLNDNLLLDKTENLNYLISELINYTKIHFSHEETYLEQIRYGQIEAHKKQHREFENKLTAFDLDSAEDNFELQNETVQNLLSFLVNWLISHISKVDMLYVK